jgi:hypothetical protein
MPADDFGERRVVHGHAARMRRRQVVRSQLGAWVRHAAILASTDRTRTRGTLFGAGASTWLG